MKASVPYLFVAGIQIINYQTDVLMLGVLSSQQEVGLYRVALQMTDMLVVSMMGISMVIAPQIAKYISKDNIPELKRVMVFAHRLSCFLILPPALILLVYGEMITSVVFGHEYADAYMAISVLSTGKTLYSLIGFAGLFLGMVGRPDVAVKIGASIIIINIALNFFLIPMYGIVGAAYATVIGYSLVNLCGIYWIRKKF